VSDSFLLARLLARWHLLQTAEHPPKPLGREPASACFMTVNSGFPPVSVAPLQYSLASFATVAALRANTATTLATVFCSSFVTLGDGGEGTFTPVASDTTSSDNGGTIIVDGASQRWYRAAGTPTIYVAWFGAIGNGTTDDTAAIQAALNAASTKGGGTVLLAPKKYAISATGLNIPSWVTLKGDDAVRGQNLSGNYSSEPFCLWLNPAGTITTNFQSGLTGISIIASTYVVPTTARIAQTSVAAWTGSAITMQPHECTIENCFLLGFALGISSPNQCARFHIRNIDMDCLAGVNIVTCGDVGRIANVHLFPFYTATPAWQTAGVVTITNVANNGSGLCRVTTSTAHGFLTGDSINVFGFVGTTMTSAQGRWTVTVISTTVFDCQGSTFAGTYPAGSGHAIMSVGWFRPGTGYYIYNSNVLLDDCFVFGHQTGMQLDTGANWVMANNFGVDMYLAVQDPFTFGIDICGNAGMNTFNGGWITSVAVPIIHNSTSVRGNVFTGMQISNNGSAGNELFQALAGSLTLIGVQFTAGPTPPGGYMHVFDTMTSMILSGCYSDGVQFEFQTANGPGQIATFVNGKPYGGGMVVLESTGVGIFTGTGAPTISMPNGSLYLRADGGVGSHLYITTGGGAWTALAGA
jgi:hypothetical protein